jgi:F-type H+-transporting ATPase subunit epsilon
MHTLQIDIVSAEGHVYSGEATLVVADACEGQLGIAPRHAPLLTRLNPGEVRVVDAGQEERVFYVSGGILEVQSHHVTVLADTAVRGEDIDEDAAEAARLHAQRAVHGAHEKQDLRRAEHELAEANARYRVLQSLKGRRKVRSASVPA